jgi:hypothetical protein
MTVSITVFEDKSQVGNSYRVLQEVTTSSGIAKKIFVKVESTYEYDRVATLDDMLNLPDAPDPLAGYYRDHTFYRDFEDVSEANYFSNGVKERIGLLANEYDQAVNLFIGTSSEVISSVNP